MKQVLKRSSQGIIGGVCAGIAEWFGWTQTRVRAIYVLASLLSAAFPGLLVYILLWILLPPPEYHANK
ncbi:MAG: PspC domain-containing protein [Sedimentisphaerales bacterium]|nr:PspC domain-containing protein [Sedimentisphaerales bacterium]